VIVVAVGLPGRFGEWCATAIAALLAGEVDVRAIPALGDMLGYKPLASPLDGIAQALIATGAPHLVVVVGQPDARLRRALAESGARFVVALDHPRNAAADLFDEPGGDPHLAIRAVANSCATVMRFAHLPGALLLHGDQARADPGGVVAALASHLGLSASAADLARVAARLPVLPADAGAGDNDEPLPAAVRKTMHAALAGYDECFAGQGMGQLAWSRELFAVTDPDKRTTDILDLAGGQRTLVFGPYIYLPPGSWTAKVYLGLSPEAAGHTLLIDAYAGGELAAASLQPASGGIFVTDVNFALDEASDHPIEIRVSVMQNATGRLAFGRVILQPQAMRRPDAIAGMEDFASALDL
jgi:hypothetical protein